MAWTAADHVLGDPWEVVDDPWEAPPFAVRDGKRCEARQRPSPGRDGHFAACMEEMALAEAAERRRYAQQLRVPVQAPEEELAPLATLETPPPGSRVAPTTVRDAPRVTGGPPRRQPKPLHLWPRPSSPSPPCALRARRTRRSARPWASADSEPGSLASPSLRASRPAASSGGGKGVPPTA